MKPQLTKNALAIFETLRKARLEELQPLFEVYSKFEHKP